MAGTQGTPKATPESAAERLDRRIDRRITLALAAFTPSAEFLAEIDRRIAAATRPMNTSGLVDAGTARAIAAEVSLDHLRRFLDGAKQAAQER